MNFTKDTKLTDILDAYPDLPAKLKELSPAFEMVGSPFARVMLSNMTLEDVSGRTGLDIKVIIRKLQELTK